MKDQISVEKVTIGKIETIIHPRKPARPINKSLSLLKRSLWI